MSNGAGLARKLGLFDMTLLVMGTVIGTGIFVVPHGVAGLVHTYPLVLGAWVLGGLVALAGSLSYAELVRRRPHVGGQYAFLREAYNPAIAFVYGWSLLWVIQSGGMASVAVIFAGYFLELMALLNVPALDFTVAPTAQAVVTSLAIGILTLINCTGVRAASTTQNIFMTLKILAIVMLVVCGLLFAESAGTRTGGVEAKEATSATSNWQLASDFGAALVMVFFAYGGWHTATFMAAEVNDPRRTMSRGLILGVGGVIVLYLAVNFVCLQVLGIDNLAASKQPASDVMYRALGRPGAVLISIGIAISALGFLSQATLTSPRVYYAMARDGLFFEGVAWIHPRTRVPVVAILLQGLFAMVIAVSGTFEQILKYVMSVELLFLSLTALSLFIIRRRDATEVDGGQWTVDSEEQVPSPSTVHRPPSTIPGHPATTILFAGVNLAVLANLFYTAPVNSLIGLGIAFAGVPVYFVWRSVAGGEGNRGAPLSAVTLINAVIEDRKSFKQVGLQLESFPPDQLAVDRLVAAYRDGSIPGWLAVYLLGCVGHVAGYETGMTILLANEGKSYAGVALFKMEKARAFEDLRQAIFSGQHPNVRRDAAYGLALYQSEEAISAFLKAYDDGRLLPLRLVAYNVAQCSPTDTTLLGLLRSQNSRNQKLAFAVIEWLVTENMQLRRPGKEVAAAVYQLLKEPDISMPPHRKEKLSAWANSVQGVAT